MDGNRFEKPSRKPIRLDGYDYSRNGAYFVTICTKNKMCIFWEPDDRYRLITNETGSSDHPDVGAHSVRPPIQDNKKRLSEFGWAVKRSFQILSANYPMVHFEKYVIMPNHIHMIIMIHNDNSGRTECAPTVSQIIKNFKENVTRQIGFSVWQKSFYDRILRNEHEYRAACRYIADNPANWEQDELFTNE